MIINARGIGIVFIKYFGIMTGKLAACLIGIGFRIPKGLKIAVNPSADHPVNSIEQLHQPFDQGRTAVRRVDGGERCHKGCHGQAADQIPGI